MIQTDDYQQVEVTSDAALWDWLAAHHGQDASVWLVTWKKSDPKRYLSRDQVLDALVAFGWIDGIRRKLDDSRTMQLISPRKVQHWAKSYKDRAARLIEEGRMQAPGLASIEAGKASGLWTFMDDVDALITPDDLSEAFEARRNAFRFFEKSPEAYRRNLLRWVKLAKTDGTRRKRIDKIVSACDAGDRIAQM
ncbi:MAG: YdeI/OmpD-associated family protein [Paracoccaceae bacterium]|nr:YdeI/OmpD-associated family protein [Paracoccaceae bacterium]